MKTVIKFLLLFAISTSALAENLENFNGRFHRPDSSWDSYNLYIRNDGYFKWHLDGCDYARGAEGTWKLIDEKILLLPNPRESNNWPAMLLSKPSKEAFENGTAFISEVVATDGTTITDREGIPRPQPQIVWVKGQASPKCRGVVR